jgi:rubrerythrin
MLPELKVRLEEMAADEAGHARESRRVLEGFEAPAFEPLAECVGHG